MFRSAGLVAGLLLTTAMLVWVAGAFGSPSAEAGLQPQVSPDEPTFLTLLNLTESSRIVRLERVDETGETVSAQIETVPSEEVLTVVFDLGSELAVFRTSCSGCATTTVGLAAGQRAIVFIAVVGDPVTQRTDIRVVNESGVRQVGTLRTGGVPGAGRRVIAFDLADGEVAWVGVRLRPSQLLDLNLTCDRCSPQVVRVGNGVDLELPLR